MRLRLILILLSLLAVLSASTAGYLYYSSVEKTALKEAEKEVALRAGKIQNTLSSYLSENLKTVKALAGLSELRDALAAPGGKTMARANAVLDHFEKALSADVCYLMDRQGNTLASSNRSDPDSFVGHNFSFRPYWEIAIHGSPATYMALGVQSMRRGIYYSHPVYKEEGRAPLGVAVIKSPVRIIEDEFRNTYEGTVLLTDPHGITFITNRKEWLFQSLWELTPGQKKSIAETQQFGEGPWEWIGMSAKDANKAVDRSGKEYAIFEMEVEHYPGWKVIYLRDLDDISVKFARPLLKASGPIVLILCLLVGGSVFLLYRKASDDIVRRRAAEEALKSAKGKLRKYSEDLERQVKKRTEEITSILKYTPAVVYIKDRDGHYTYINSRYEELFGVRNEEVRGKSDGQIFTAEYAERFMENDQRVLREGRSLNVEEEVPHHDGVHTYLSVKFPIFDEGGVALGLCGISTDITDIKRARDQLRRLSDSIMEGQEKERAALSRELHDGLGQVLTALRMDAVWLGEQVAEQGQEGGERVRSMCDTIDRAIDEVRRMSAGLRPGVLDDLGIIDALDWYTDKFTKRTGIDCIFRHDAPSRLPETLSTAIYRITQETLTNVSRHASPTNVEVSLSAKEGLLTLAVTDDGRGFDMEGLDETGGLGLAGMRERAGLAGGSVEILSRPGEGTRVEFRVPLNMEGGDEVDQGTSGR